MIEAVTRLLPGVLGNEASAVEESFSESAGSSTRSTPGPPSSGAGRCPRCCARATTAGSRGGGGRRRCAARSTAGPTSLADAARTRRRRRCWPSSPSRRPPGRRRVPLASRAVALVVTGSLLMHRTDLVDRAQSARRHPRLRPRRHPEGARPRGRGQPRAGPGVPGRRDPPPGQRRPRRPSRSARSASASASSAPSRCIRRSSPRSRSSPGATSAGPSSTTCGTGSERPPRSRKSGSDPDPAPGRSRPPKAVDRRRSYTGAR